MNRKRKFTHVKQNKKKQLYVKLTTCDFNTTEEFVKVVESVLKSKIEICPLFEALLVFNHMEPERFKKILESASSYDKLSCINYVSYIKNLYPEHVWEDAGEKIGKKTMIAFISDLNDR